MAACQRDTQLATDRGQRDIDDGRIQDVDEQPSDERDSNQVLVDHVVRARIDAARTTVQ
jgi:hypothetical protein